jgi:hypothetical protein
VAIDVPWRQLLVSSLALCFSACRTTPADLTGYTEEEAPRLSSSITVADRNEAAQLVSGWERIEDNAWRWTAPRFSAVLRPPPGSATRGAILQFHFFLPKPEMSRLQQVTLSASIQGVRLAPQTYSTIGEVLYQREVPAAILSGESVRLDFTLDKSFVPVSGDPRALGVVAKSVSLETK